MGHLTFPSEVLNYASQSCATVNASTSGGDCALCVMSAGASALYVQDNKAKVSVVGAIDVKGGISNNGTICAKASQADPGCGGPAPKSSVAALTDPLASSYPAPTVKTLGTVSVIGGVKTATPGVYTASNLALLNSAATLQPGAYVIAGGSYQPPDVSGSGVMIYLTCSGYLTGGCRQGSNGWATLTIFNTSVNLSAPTGGVYSGLVIFADRNNNSSPTLSFQNSGGTSTISGTMYAVAGSISLQANNATLSGGGRIVVGTANVQGSNNSVGLDLTSPSVDTPCSAYDESVTGVPSTGTTGFGRVAFQTACSGGSAIVDFNYGP